MGDIDLNYAHRQGEKLVQKVHLLTCSLNDAPERSDSAGVYSVGRIDMDMSNVPLSSFESKVVGGITVYQVRFIVRVHLGAAEGLVTFSTLAHGKVVGSTSISYVDE